eukprot:3575383-Prymnesium_polylepis.1
MPGITEMLEGVSKEKAATLGGVIAAARQTTTGEDERRGMHRGSRSVARGRWPLAVTAQPPLRRSAPPPSPVVASTIVSRDVYMREGRGVVCVCPAACIAVAETGTGVRPFSDTAGCESSPCPAYSVFSQPVKAWPLEASGWGARWRGY